jgi:prepilin-type processing-associated H-X9-DG protein
MLKGMKSCLKHALTRDLASRSRCLAGFTIIELLVVIATTAVLAVLLLPGLARAQTLDQRIICFENLRQLTMGWLMYAHGNNDRIARTAGMDSLVTNPNDPTILPGGARAQWCPGSMDTIANGRTNLTLLERGTIFPYVRNTKVYKCPADTRLSQGVLAVRSVSMNCWFNPIYEWTETRGKVLRKLTDMTTLPPSRTWALIEENPYSINDGWLITDVALDPRAVPWWVDYPASYHDNAATLSFADGHVELKKWSDPNALAPPKGNPRSPGTGPDLEWLSERSTVVKGQ